MASMLYISLPISNIVMMIMITISTMTSSSQAISSCGGPCRTLNDCEGQLICINGKCNDDPDVGTRICSSSSSPPPPRGGGGSGCSQAGTLTCDGRTYPTYRCSPLVTSSTVAKLTNNDFSEGGDGGGPSFCTGRYYLNTDKVVALSTGWFDGGSKCGRTIRIRAANGRTTTAKVVDECDSMMGCDEEHAYQPPCKNNIVDGSDAVWTALALDKNVGIVDVTWSFV